MARLGELLVRENIISVKQLQAAQDEQKRSGGRLGSSLVKLGLIGEGDLLSFLSKQYHVPSINLDDFQIDAEIIKLINEDVAQKHQVIPVHRSGSSLVIAMADPSNIYAIDDVKFLTGYNVEVVVASETQIAKAIERSYKSGNEGASYDEVMQGFDEGEIDFSGDDEGNVNVND
ncbi:MAG: type II secretion system protein GspE, partial [Myxococcota bacterium]